LKDRKKFNMDEVTQALGDRYGDGVQVLTEPTQ
jgi:hypothetical protein